MHFKKNSIIALCGVLAVTSLAFAGCGKKQQTDTGRTTQESAASSDLEAVETLKFDNGKKTYEVTDNIRTYLILGTDHSGDEDADGDDYTGSMADFLLLAVFNKTENTWGFLEINRDTITQVKLIDENGEGEATSDMQICTAHWYGGNKKMSCLNTADAVSHLTGGLRVNGYYSISMDHIRDINHTIGGVTVKIKDDFSKVDPTLKEGEKVHLTDEQAYNYLHARMDVGDGSNIARMHRQEAYLRGMLRKIRKEMADDPSVFTDKFRELEKYCTTNLTGDDISGMQDVIDQGEDLGILSPKGKNKTGTKLNDGIRHAEFYVKESSLIHCLERLCNLSEESGD